MTENHLSQNDSLAIYFEKRFGFICKKYVLFISMLNVWKCLWCVEINSIIFLLNVMRVPTEKNQSICFTNPVRTNPFRPSPSNGYRRGKILSQPPKVFISAPSIKPTSPQPLTSQKVQINISRHGTDKDGALCQYAVHRTYACV